MDANMSIIDRGGAVVGEVNIPTGGGERMVMQAASPSGAAALAGAATGVVRLIANNPFARSLLPPQAVAAVSAAKLVGGWLGRLLRKRAPAAVPTTQGPDDIPMAKVAAFAGAAALALSTLGPTRLYFVMQATSDGVTLWVLPTEARAREVFARAKRGYAALYGDGKVLAVAGADVSGADGVCGEVGLFRSLWRRLRGRRRKARRRPKPDEDKPDEDKPDEDKPDEDKPDDGGWNGED